ncbi:MAG: hypothetical protein AAGF60_02695 [Pseudomonadota bacterium]
MTQLINFNMPLPLKRRLDQVAKAKGVSRTSILLLLVENYCRQEFSLMQRDYDQELQETDYDPPMIPSVDDFDPTFRW